MGGGGNIEANTIIAAYYICYKADYIQLDVKAKT